MSANEFVNKPYPNAFYILTPVMHSNRIGLFILVLNFHRLCVQFVNFHKGSDVNKQKFVNGTPHGGGNETWEFSSRSPFFISAWMDWKSEEVSPSL